MRKLRIYAAIGIMALAFGCSTTRSISRSQYIPETGYYQVDPTDQHIHAAFGYHGELSEHDVLALDPERRITEADIAEALANTASPTLRRGATILLVQSGAVIPDVPMVAELERDFKVVPFSGVPTDAHDGSRGAYSRLLRLTAARAGCETIVCYWGILESGRSDVVTKTISWVPLAGWVLPDEKQAMRIRLKVAVIDVRSGKWTVISPAAHENRAISTRLSRGSSDQQQVESLKRLAYASAARELGVAPRQP
jgi:hypothetical protein